MWGSYTPTFKNLEVRKVQFSGRTSYMLALPKKWAEEMNLRQGDTLTLSRRSVNSILVIKDEVQNFISKGDETVVELKPGTHGRDFMVRNVIAAYTAGYSKIEVEPSKSKAGGLTPSERALVRNVVRQRLMGCEVVSDSDKRVSIRVLLGHSQMSLKSSITRMASVASGLFLDSLRLQNDSDSSQLMAIVENDDVIRFHNYIARHLNAALSGLVDLETVGLKRHEEVLAYHVTLAGIKKTADCAVATAKRASVLSQRIRIGKACINERTIRLAESAVAMLGESIEALLQENHERADDVLKNSSELLAAIERAIEEDGAGGNTSSYESANVQNALALSAIMNITSAANEVAEIVLGLTITNGKEESQAVIDSPMVAGELQVTTSMERLNVPLVSDV
jgi:phosphate uptake regulator